MKKKLPIDICSAAEGKIYENFVDRSKAKSLIDQTLISKSLSKHFIFSALLNDPATHNDLIEAFKYCSLSEDEYLLKENDQASSFFILDEGLLQVEINGVAKKRLYSGEGFG